MFNSFYDSYDSYVFDISLYNITTLTRVSISGRYRTDIRSRVEALQWAKKGQRLNVARFIGERVGEFLETRGRSKQKDFYFPFRQTTLAPGSRHAPSQFYSPLTVIHIVESVVEFGGYGGSRESGGGGHVGRRRRQRGRRSRRTRLALR